MLQSKCLWTFTSCSCTANAHLLSHLSKYVRLWGPLWSHSAFGFESKNASRFTSRPGMICVGKHSYIIGQCKLSTPTTEQSTALGYAGNIEVYSRLLKDGIVYHSTSYKKLCGKRNNIYCRYISETGDFHFGMIESFTNTPYPFVFIRQVQQSATSLIQRAGHPCRVSLLKYQTVDMLGSFIISIDLSANRPLVAIPIDSIISKVCVVSVCDSKYFIVQPNNIERH